MGGEFEGEVALARAQRRLPEGLFRALGREGLFRAAHRSGEDLAEVAAALEGLLYGVKDCGVASSVIIHHCVCHLVGRYAVDATRISYASLLSGGQCPSAVAMTEPQGGSAAFEPRTRLVETPDGLVLQGEKWHITNAPVAGILVVFAKDERVGGLSAVLVDSDWAGVERCALQPSGMRSAPVGRLVFRDVRVPRDHLLGEAGGGVAIFNETTTREKILVAAATVGLFGRVLDDMMSYAQERTSGGKPIGHFQYVRARLTDVKVGLEATRGLTRAALGKYLSNEDASVEASIAKMYAADYGISAATHAMKLFGSHGFEESGLSDLMLGSIGASLGGGTEEAQRELIYKGLYVEHRRAHRNPSGGAVTP
jgi:alkylation response protein AidB-like acyl-CoA dehydrogenase